MSSHNENKYIQWTYLTSGPKSSSNTISDFENEEKLQKKKKRWQPSTRRGHVIMLRCSNKA